MKAPKKVTSTKKVAVKPKSVPKPPAKKISSGNTKLDSAIKMVLRKPKK